jgi:hypothetical protein
MEMKEETMSLEDNKALVRTFLIQSNKERRTLVELCAPGITFHIGGTPAMDLQAFQHFQARYYAAFPDSQVTIEEMVAEGDRVAFRLVFVQPMRQITWASRPAARRSSSRSSVSHILPMAGLPSGGTRPTGYSGCSRSAPSRPEEECDRRYTVKDQRGGAYG